MDNLIEKLKELGFNSYEAKVYLALLKKYPATGYEVSQLSDVPQSRAYDALKSLEVEGIVHSTAEKPQRYTPVSPKELTQRFKRRINSTIDYLEKKLPAVNESYNEPIYNISGYDKNIEKIKEVINNTKKSLYIVVWSADFKALETELTSAYDRGVEIKIVGFDNFQPTMVGLVYRHEAAKEIEMQVGGRLIYLVSDYIETVFGRIESNVVWSKNLDIAYFLKEFISHDMYLLDVSQRFPEQLKYFYGPDFVRLKEKIADNKSSYNLKG